MESASKQMRFAGTLSAMLSGELACCKRRKGGEGSPAMEGQQTLGFAAVRRNGSGGRSEGGVEIAGKLTMDQT